MFFNQKVNQLFFCTYINTYKNTRTHTLLFLCMDHINESKEKW